MPTRQESGCGARKPWVAGFVAFACSLLLVVDGKAAEGDAAGSGTATKPAGRWEVLIELPDKRRPIPEPVKPGQKVTKLLIVRGKEPFTLSGVECDSERFEFKVGESAAKLHRIPVTFTAGESATTIRQTIRIKTGADGAIMSTGSVFAKVVSPVTPD